MKLQNRVNDTYFLAKFWGGMANSSMSEESVFLSNSCCPFFFRRPPNLPLTRASKSRLFFIFLGGLKSTFILVWGSSLPGLLWSTDLNQSRCVQRQRASLILTVNAIHKMFGARLTARLFLGHWGFVVEAAAAPRPKQSNSFTTWA